MEPSSSRRFVMNTGYLYAKMAITVFVSLYSVRLILKALGASDFGTFSVVGAAIAMLSFLNASMTGASQRFLAFNLGSGDKKKLNSVFNASIIIHMLIGLLVVIVLEIASIFLFDGVLNIPPDRIHSAKIVFHCLILSTFFTIISVPYNAAISAHENLLVDSIIGVYESAMKLVIAFVLLSYSHDRLILYGILMASLAISVTLIARAYSHRKYEECKINFKSGIDFGLIKEMLAFSGWTVFGSLCFMVRNQGIAFVLNIYFGVLLNAAYGIANQVNGQLSSFAQNMYKALYPQMFKSEGGGDRKRMVRLSVYGCRIASILMAFFAIPLIIEMPFVLDIWLDDEIPEYAVIFTRLVLVIRLIQLFTSGLIGAVNSTGKIRAFTLTLGILLIMTIPVGLILLRNGLPAYYVFVGSIAIELIAMVVRIWFAEKIVGLASWDFFFKVILRLLIIYTIVGGLGVLSVQYMEQGFIRFIVTGIITSVSLILTSWFFLFSGEERIQIKSVAKSILGKVGIGKK